MEFVGDSVMKKMLLLAACSLLFVSGGKVFADGKTNAELKVVVKGFDAPTGSVRVAVFDSKKEFPYGKHAAEATIDVNGVPTNQAVSASFKLPPGTYVVAIIHDRNNNGKMDMNPIFSKFEKYGFSRNPGFTFGAPSFDKVAIDLKQEGTEITVILK
jgi:uncharacterized protein (DUF2141 family)